MCTTTDEENVFAQAADEIQSVPIVWHRKIQPKKITQCSSSSSSGEASSSCSSSSCNSYSIGTKNVEVEQNYNEHSNRTSITGSPRSVVTALSAGSSSSQDKYSTEYMRFDAVMSLCDTESGPALEIRTATSASRKILRTLETSDLADFDESMDVVSILKSSKSKSKSKPQSKNANANANKRHVKFEEDEDAVIERIIPLDVIECAAPGGAGVFDWENIFNVGSGNLDCSVKVYSCKFLAFASVL